MKGKGQTSFHSEHFRRADAGAVSLCYDPWMTNPMKLLLALLTLTMMAGAALAQSRKEIYELQERCGNRAEQIFEKDFPVRQRKGLELFENHYNVRLNRCFMLEENTMIT